MPRQSTPRQTASDLPQTQQELRQLIGQTVLDALFQFQEYMMQQQIREPAPRKIDPEMRIDPSDLTGEIL
jgi:regulator of protease activity HflC (stomatin/prohibitin superfamily)